MNALTTASANAGASQTTVLNKRFKKVRDAAIESENAESDAGSKLNNAMGKLYEFGEQLIGPFSNPDEPSLLAFLKDRKVKLNAVKRRNPYVALTELAFTDSSPSLRSQRAKVLAFARHSCVPANDFSKWISEEGGLKGRLKEAVKFFGGTAQANNQAERENRLDRAKDYLNKLPALANFSLPGLDDGFAIVLARIADGQAQAIHVLAHEDHEIEKLKAELVPFDPAGPARRKLLATLPLGQLWRAIDLIFLATAPKQAAQVRSIALRNTVRDNQAVCEVLSVSAARDEATATVIVAGHIGALPLDEYFVLYSAIKTAGDEYGLDGAAELFHQSFAEHANWAVQGTTLVADDLAFPITLQPLADDHSFRVADDLPATSKTFTVDRAGMTALLAYIDAEAIKAKPAKGAKQAYAMDELMEMEDAPGEFRLRSVGSTDDVLIGTSNHTLAPEMCDLAYADLQRVAQALTAYEVDADGYFLDGQTDDACVRFDAEIGSDQLTIIVPTRFGEVRNRFRVPLETAARMQEAA